MSKLPVSDAECRSMVGTLRLRLPKHIIQAIEHKANLEGNKLSATARRLLSLGLRADEQREA